MAGMTHEEQWARDLEGFEKFKPKPRLERPRRRLMCVGGGPKGLALGWVPYYPKRGKDDGLKLR